MRHRVSVSREKRGLGRPDSYMLLRRAVRAVLAAENICEDCEVSIMLTDDDGIHKINLAQRGIDSATDVLSFPFSELAPGSFRPDACVRNPETGAVFLGDIVISVPRCEEQGRLYGGGFGHELTYLAVHSTLHLLGYDHTDEGADKRLMRGREKEIMLSLTGAEI